MSYQAYIVDASALAEIPKGVEWHASTVPSDTTKSLVAIRWDDNPNLEAVFESRADVLPLGKPWEPLPAEAVPLLASFQDTPDPAKAMSIPTAPTEPDTVSAALRKTTWAMARLVK